MKRRHGRKNSLDTLLTFNPLWGGVRPSFVYLPSGIRFRTPPLYSKVNSHPRDVEETQPVSFILWMYFRNHYVNHQSRMLVLYPALLRKREEDELKDINVYQHWRWQKLKNLSLTRGATGLLYKSVMWSWVPFEWEGKDVKSHRMWWKSWYDKVEGCLCWPERKCLYIVETLCEHIFKKVSQSGKAVS